MLNEQICIFVEIIKTVFKNISLWKREGGGREGIAGYLKQQLYICLFLQTQL